MNTMTRADARNRIEATLSEWRSIGDVARSLGISRSSVAREVTRMAGEGRLESQVQRFWRNGDWRTGCAYRRSEPVECAPTPGTEASLEERVRAIVEEAWASRCPWAVRPAVTASGSGSVLVSDLDWWEELNDETEAGRSVWHMDACVAAERGAR